MADERDEPAAPQPASTGEGQSGPAEPPYQIMIQYIKDLSFENPNSPAVFSQGEQPKAALTLDVATNPLTGRDVEVVLTIEAKAQVDGKTAYVLELAYAAVVRIGQVPKEALNALLYVEIPRMLFPFLREIVCDTTRAGGFSMLMLAPFDFVQIYRQRMAQEQQAAESETV
ncbi:MAG: protein-export chaperone SecB [Alphaproteobacteria bacterium]|nr:protein-export chaperone SecB [Alphaproteobacteria bacterium]